MPIIVLPSSTRVNRLGRQDVNELEPVEIVTEQVSSLAFTTSPFTFNPPRFRAQQQLLVLGPCQHAISVGMRLIFDLS